MGRSDPAAGSPTERVRRSSGSRLEANPELASRSSLPSMGRARSLRIAIRRLPRGPTLPSSNLEGGLLSKRRIQSLEMTIGRAVFRSAQVRSARISGRFSPLPVYPPGIRLPAVERGGRRSARRHSRLHLDVRLGAQGHGSRGVSSTRVAASRTPFRPVFSRSRAPGATCGSEERWRAACSHRTATWPTSRRALGTASSAVALKSTSAIAGSVSTSTRRRTWERSQRAGC